MTIVQMQYSISCYATAIVYINHAYYGRTEMDNGGVGKLKQVETTKSDNSLF